MRCGKYVTVVSKETITSTPRIIVLRRIKNLLTLHRHVRPYTHPHPHPHPHPHLHPYPHTNAQANAFAAQGVATTLFGATKTLTHKDWISPSVAEVVPFRTYDELYAGVKR